MVEVGYFLLGLLIGAGVCWVLAPLCQGFILGWSEVRSDCSDRVDRRGAMSMDERRLEGRARQSHVRGQRVECKNSPPEAL